MLKFIFNNRRNERLSSNSRQSLGTGFKKSSSNGSRHDSWQNNFNKNTLSSSSCQSCSAVNCPSWWELNSPSSNDCQWKCLSTTPGVYFYCNGIP